MPRTDGGWITSTKASRQSLHLGAQVVQDHVAGEADALPERLQDVTNTTPALGALVSVASIQARKCHRVGDARTGQHEFRGLRTTASVLASAGAGRQRDGGDEIALVERRDEAGRRAGELETVSADQPGIDHQHQAETPQHPPVRRGVAERQALEDAG